jgi:hypothetical protein
LQAVFKGHAEGGGAGGELFSCVVDRDGSFGHGGEEESGKGEKQWRLHGDGYILESVFLLLNWCLTRMEFGKKHDPRLRMLLDKKLETDLMC